MTYLEVINLLKLVFETIRPGGKFVQGKRTDINLASDNTDWPMCALMPFRESKDYKEKTISRQVLMYFITKDSDENTPVDRDGLIDDMNALVDEFFIKLLDVINNNPTYRGEINLSGKLMITPELQILTAYASGYGVSFTLDSKIKLC